MTLIQIEEEREVTETPAISLTESAVSRVRGLIEERSLEDHALRVFVSGGGCSGYQYGMALDGEPRANDVRFSFGGVDVIVDPISITYLSGCTIDYVDDLMGGGFRIENPNAVASCGCGHSFRTSESDAAAASGEACC